VCAKEFISFAYYLSSGRTILNEFSLIKPYVFVDKIDLKVQMMNDTILLVDDNKTLSKLVTLKLRAQLQVDVTQSYSYQEAKQLLEAQTFTLAILDLNLPDAPNGEIVDLLLAQKIPSIVLTGSIDKQVRQTMLKKDIIDFINKNSMEDIDYVVDEIKRLFKNRQHKVMVVDDSVVFRKQMKKMVENMFFNVYTLAHGEEALLILKEHPDIKMVITDYNMPVMDGLELTKQIRKTHKKDQLAIFILSSAQESDISAMFLKQGANDFIHKPFSKEEFSCRLNNAIEALENIETITQFSNRDFLTGLYNRRYFFKEMEPYFNEALDNEEAFATAMISLDEYNNLYHGLGQEAGDRVVMELADLLRANIDAHAMLARFSEDEFCIVLKNTTATVAQEMFELLRQRVGLSSLVHQDKEIHFSISVGVALHSQDTLMETLNEADSKLYDARHAGGNCIVT
jgi:diguanylate cyclase (GGDEF)-like protein